MHGQERGSGDGGQAPEEIKVSRKAGEGATSFNHSRSPTVLKPSSGFALPPPLSTGQSLAPKDISISPAHFCDFTFPALYRSLLGLSLLECKP